MMYTDTLQTVIMLIGACVLAVIGKFYSLLDKINKLGKTHERKIKTHERKISTHPRT